MVAEAVRLNKYLARAGVASRRRADAMIADGSVRINGTTVRELGTLVGAGDLVEVGGVPVELPRAPTYLIFNEPLGVVTTMRDPHGRRSIADFLVDRMPALEQEWNAHREALRAAGELPGSPPGPPK